MNIPLIRHVGKVTLTALTLGVLVNGCVIGRAGKDDDGPSGPPTVGNGQGGESGGGPSNPFGVVINEFVASNESGAVDEFGEPDDWIELYNRTDEDVDLTGFYVSDNENRPTKGLLYGITIEAHSTVLLWADGQPDQGHNHLPFKLGREGESVVLTSPEPDLATLDIIYFENAPTDASFARVPDGTGNWVPNCHTPTPNAPNDPTCAQ